MAGKEGCTPRERYRSQVRAEIKERAWEQIAASEAPGLSLNAIAKQMGLSGPALYRHFSGRDELITERLVEGPGGGSGPDGRLDEHLAEHRQWAGDHPADPAALRHALTFWTRLHGVLSLEPAGHFTGMGFDPGLLHGAELDDLTHAVP